MQSSVLSIRHRLHGSPFCTASLLILRWLHRLHALAARSRDSSGLAVWPAVLVLVFVDMGVSEKGKRTS